MRKTSFYYNNLIFLFCDNADKNSSSLKRYPLDFASDPRDIAQNQCPFKVDKIRGSVTARFRTNMRGRIFQVLSLFKSSVTNNLRR